MDPGTKNRAATFFNEQQSPIFFQMSKTVQSDQTAYNNPSTL
jgi:hypothetical protein